MKKAKPRKRLPYCTWPHGRYGILNHLGSPWTPATFDTEQQAKNYLAREQERNPTWKLGKHKVVPVSVTVRALTS